MDPKGSVLLLGATAALTAVEMAVVCAVSKIDTAYVEGSLAGAAVRAVDG